MTNNQKEDAIVVTIGVYSGLPNPEMVLTSDAAGELVKLLGASVGVESIHQPPPPKLGEFYGYHINIPPHLGKTLAAARRVEVVHRVVTVIVEGKKSHWRDVSGVQQYLTRAAYREGHGDVLREIGVAEDE